MEELKLWAKLYQEIAKKFNDNLPEIEWVDLWHNQVGFLDEEHPFPTPALFLSFRLLNTEDLQKNTQKLTVQLDVYYFYETFLDTFSGASNEVDALAYLNTVTDIHVQLHGQSGAMFSECKRIGFGAVDTGSAGNLYRQSFTMEVYDDSAAPEEVTAIPGDITTTSGDRPEKVNPKPYRLLQ